MGDDREELLPLALARQEIGDVVEGHDPRDDLAIRAVHRRCGDLDVAALARVGPRHKELGLGRLSSHRSIQRVRTWGDGAAGHQVFDVDGAAKLRERLELWDTKDLSRAEKGSLSMERVSYDLAVVLREVVQRYVDATLEEGRHVFTVEAPATVPAHGDQSRVEQLLMNLVGNAVKYSPTGGQVRVALTAGDRTAEIAISDQGIGIPPDEISKLGHPFVRGAGRANSFAGMGVGLYVARIVAEAHAGSLELESDGDDKGTTVRVKLPL